MQDLVNDEDHKKHRIYKLISINCQKIVEKLNQSQRIAVNSDIL